MHNLHNPMQERAIGSCSTLSTTVALVLCPNTGLPKLFSDLIRGTGTQVMLWQVDQAVKLKGHNVSGINLLVRNIVTNFVWAWVNADNGSRVPHHCFLTYVHLLIQLTTNPVCCPQPKLLLPVVTILSFDQVVAVLFSWSPVSC